MRTVMKADMQRDPAPRNNYWRRRFGGKHPLFVWTRQSKTTAVIELKSPLIGYAPPEYRMKPWPEEARIAGWFPILWESNMVS